MRIPAPASRHARKIGLAKRWPEDRAIAVKAIQDMGPHAIPFLLQVIEEQTRGVKQRRRGHVALTMVTAVYVILGFCEGPHFTTGPRFDALFAYFLLFLSFTAAPFCGNPTRLQSNAGALFAQLATRENVGALIYLLEHTDGKCLRMIRLALARIFSQMQVSDARSLTAEHRRILAYQLSQPPKNGQETEAAFIIALLKALQQIGDGTFVGPVKRLARLDGYGSGKKVQAASRECLPYLEAFAERERQSGTLVRAATAPDNEQTSALLLRPAGIGRTSDAQAVLVRPLEETE